MMNLPLTDWWWKIKFNIGDLAIASIHDSCQLGVNWTNNVANPFVWLQHLVQHRATLLRH